LARQIRNAVDSMAYIVWIYAALSTAVLVYLTATQNAAEPRRQQPLYLVQGFGLCCVVVFVAEMMIAVSPDRSAKAVATEAHQHVSPATQAVFYDTYLSGMAFYLRTDRPIWLVNKGKNKRTFLGNYYALNNRPEPVTPWGKAMLDFDEFHDRWRSVKQPLLIIVKEKNLPRLQENVGQALRRIAAVNEYLLVERP
jgi:hypothetical protein